jgi:hypothetical protein
VARARLAIAALFVLFLSACQSARTADWNNLPEAFVAGDPEAQSEQDLSKAGLARAAAWYRARRQEALAVDPAALTPEQRLDRGVLIAVCDARLFWLETARSPETNPASYARFLRPKRGSQAPERARAVVAACDQIRANLVLPLSRPLLERGIVVFDGLARAWAEETGDAGRDASRALSRVARWLEANRGKARNGYALGPEGLRAMVRAVEQVPDSLESIESDGRAALERDLQETSTACARLAPSLAACARKVSGLNVVKDLTGTARRQVTELESFLRRSGLVTVPAAPAVTVQVAGSDHPSSIGLLVGSTFLVGSPEGPPPSEPSLLTVTAHETWPGHYLQALYARDSMSAFSRHYTNGLTAEGWAHFAEEWLFEHGFRKDDPRATVAMRLAALLRDARLLAVIGLHSGTMSADAAEALFRDKAFLSPVEARRETGRAINDPQCLDYALGKLRISRLLLDWLARAPGERTERSFVERFLSYGPIPLPLIEAALLSGS